MPNGFVGAGVEPPDFYIAAMGRSGSTLLCNWFTRPPDQLVFVEPFFMHQMNPRLLRIQLADFGLSVDDEDWLHADATPASRFRRIMGPRLIGRRWAFKEVLYEEHCQVLEAFRPPRILITVRDIADIALSFFEKHRIQGNLDRFDDSWVVDYCTRESAGILEFRDLLQRRAIPHHVIRYEDFTRSDEARLSAVDFVGWEPGGTIGSHMAAFDREFEVQRHGTTISQALRTREERQLEPQEIAVADAIADQCQAYQAAFAYA